MTPLPVELAARKAALRVDARMRRVALAEKDACSRAIFDRFTALPAVAAARTLLVYLDAGSEVRTRPGLPVLLATGKRVVVPWCRTDTPELELFHLQVIDELATGAFGVFEPAEHLRNLPGKLVQPADLDVLMLPGVAFDPAGNRLGQGGGYFDRLLARVRPDALLVGLAFDCQVVAQVPTGPHDVPVDVVLTETRVLVGRGRRAAGR